jgi:hypothetical protein
MGMNQAPSGAKRKHSYRGTTTPGGGGVLPGPPGGVELQLEPHDRQPLTPARATSTKLTKRIRNDIENSWQTLKT